MEKRDIIKGLVIAWFVIMLTVFALAVSFTPQGNIDLKNTYNITDAPSIIVKDNQTICFGNATGCGDSYIKFDGAKLIIKVN